MSSSPFYNEFGFYQAVRLDVHCMSLPMEIFYSILFYSILFYSILFYFCLEEPQKALKVPLCLIPALGLVQSIQANCTEKLSPKTGPHPVGAQPWAGCDENTKPTFISSLCTQQGLKSVSSSKAFLKLG